MTKVLCFDPDVVEQNLITQAFLSDVVQLNNTAEVLALTDVQRIGFVFHNDGCSVPFIKSDELVPVIRVKPHTVVTPQAETEEPTPSNLPQPARYNFYTAAFVDFLVQAKTKFANVQVDLISCSMKDTAFIRETAKIVALTGVPINYSANNTGNGNGADWILESNGENLIGVYFSEAVLLWKHALIYPVYTGSALATYMNGIQAGTITYSSATKTYTLLQDLTDSLTFNILLKQGEVFDGAGYTMSTSNNRSGIFIIDSKDKTTTIKNLTMHYGSVRNFSTVVGGGGIVRAYQSHFTINNCHSSTIMNDPYCGGLIGSCCSHFDVINCSNSGEIADTGCGGIVASRCFDFTVTDSTNTGVNNVGESDCGGMLIGPYCKDFKVTNCTNTGYLSSSYLGGIVGGFCSYFTVKGCNNNNSTDGMSYGCGGITGYACHDFTVERCVNNTAFSGSGVGGIVGYGNYNFAVKFCTNNRQINGWGSGGIVGNRCASFTVDDCTNNGAIDNNGCGGICGGNVGSTGYEYIANTFALQTYQYGRNIIEINRCVNNGTIAANDAGGICGKYCGRIISYLSTEDAFYKPYAGMKITLNDCVNNGTFAGEYDSGSILGPAAGLFNINSDNNSVYGNPHTDIYINNCISNNNDGVFGPLCGDDALENTVAIDSEQNAFNSRSSITIKKSYTRDASACVIGGLGDNVNNQYNSIIYIASDGTITDVIANPTFVAYI